MLAGAALARQPGRPIDSSRRAYDGRVRPTKAPGYWPTRILLAVAVIATSIAVAFAIWAAFLMPPMFGDDPSLFGLPGRIAVAILASGVAVVGLVWTVRIFRGPRDEPPPWRYRDR
jgi:drug/metabolite transporter (DMT)-like permease